MGPDAVAIIPGARLVRRSADTDFPFRQDSDLWYLTGFNHPDATAVFRTTPGRPAYTLFVQPRDRAAETWTGIRPGIEGAKAEFDADEAADCGSLIESIPELLNDAQRLFHSFGRDPKLDASIQAVQEDRRLHSRRGGAPIDEILDPRAPLHEMRLFKSDAEMTLMREAASITCEAHQAAAREAAPGRNEYEIEALLDYVFRRRGASGPAYGSIVAGGPNAAILHYITNDQPLRSGELLLIDAGCEFKGYASDVTRTYPVGGRFEGAPRAVYEAVLEAQQTAIGAVRPGTTLPEIHAAALRKLVEGMLDLKLLEGQIDDLIEQQAYTPYYMHSTSHWLGLDVHDVGRYAVEGKPRALEPGMVFTIEPGIYIASDDASAPESLRGIGVRIEDDIAMTKDGYENLTEAIPKTSEAIEDWMA